MLEASKRLQVAPGFSDDEFERFGTDQWDTVLDGRFALERKYHPKKQPGAFSKSYESVGAGRRSLTGIVNMHWGTWYTDTDLSTYDWPIAGEWEDDNRDDDGGYDNEQDEDVMESEDTEVIEGLKGMSVATGDETATLETDPAAGETDPAAALADAAPPATLPMDLPAAALADAAPPATLPLDTSAAVEGAPESATLPLDKPAAVEGGHESDTLPLDKPAAGEGGPEPATLPLDTSAAGEGGPKSATPSGVSPAKAGRNRKLTGGPELTEEQKRKMADKKSAFQLSKLFHTLVPAAERAGCTRSGASVTPPVKPAKGKTPAPVTPAKGAKRKTPTPPVTPAKGAPPTTPPTTHKRRKF